MTIYCLMINDRHTDPEARLFSTLEKAIDAAKDFLSGFEDNETDATMSEKELDDAGWLFYACYSVEGDSVWILPLEVDA